MENAVFENEQYYGVIADSLKNGLKNKPIIYRLTGAKSRIYFTKEGVEEPAIIYNSGTTIINNYRDVEGERAIHKWQVGLINSGKSPDKVLKTRQDYGTLLHVLYGKILSGDKFSFKTLKEDIIGFAVEVKMEKAYIKNLVERHIVEFQKDMASFLTWIREYKVEPLGIEVMLKSDKWRVATALDLICYVTVQEKGFHGEVYKGDSKATGAKKGDPKETLGDVKKLVIVDFKSGKKGFYAKNVLQLLLSREIFEENFPDLPVSSIYNFAPNDWVSNPSFKFYDQERETKNIDYLRSISENVFSRGLVEFEQVLLVKKHRVIVGGVDFNKGKVDVDIYYRGLVETADVYYTEAFVKEEEEESKK